MRVVAKDYQQLIAALSRRRRELGLTLCELDELAGLAERHSSKILGPNPTKFLGPMSLFCLLQTLGLKITIADDPEAFSTHQAPIVAAGHVAGQLGAAHRP